MLCLSAQTAATNRFSLLLLCQAGVMVPEALHVVLESGSAAGTGPISPHHWDRKTPHAHKTETCWHNLLARQPRLGEHMATWTDWFGLWEPVCAVKSFVLIVGQSAPSPMQMQGPTTSFRRNRLPVFQGHRYETWSCAPAQALRTHRTRLGLPGWQTAARTVGPLRIRGVGIEHRTELYLHEQALPCLQQGLCRREK